MSDALSCQSRYIIVPFTTPYAAGMPNGAVCKITTGHDFRESWFWIDENAVAFHEGLSCMSWRPCLVPSQPGASRAFQMEIRFLRMEIRWPQMEIRFRRMKIRSPQMEIHWCPMEIRFSRMEIRPHPMKIRFYRMKIHQRPMRIRFPQTSIAYSRMEIGFASTDVAFTGGRTPF
jgi:hypothetical protein